MMTSATITEIAAALGISQQAVNKKKKKYNWQPVNVTGIDTFDINTASGLKSHQRSGIRQFILKKLQRSDDYQSQIDEIQDQKLKLKKTIQKLDKQIRQLRVKMRGGK